jgi:hypothetical protein
MAHTKKSEKWTVRSAVRVGATSVATLLFVIFVEENLRYLIEEEHWNRGLAKGLAYMPDLSGLLDTKVFWFLFGLTCGVSISLWIVKLFPERAVSSPTVALPSEESQTPRIELLSQSGKPYETSNIVSGNRNSKATIGIKNTGRTNLSDCSVRIEKISPLLSHGKDYAILLNGFSFSMYPGQPEKMIGVATYWPHLKQYCFLKAPSLGGFFAEAMPIVDKSVRSSFIIRFKSAECTHKQPCLKHG